MIKILVKEKNKKTQITQELCNKIDRIQPPKRASGKGSTLELEKKNKKNKQE